MRFVCLRLGLQEFGWDFDTMIPWNCWLHFSTVEDGGDTSFIFFFFFTVNCKNLTMPPYPPIPLQKKGTVQLFCVMLGVLGGC